MHSKEHLQVDAMGRLRRMHSSNKQEGCLKAQLQETSLILVLDSTSATLGSGASHPSIGFAHY